MAKKTANSPKSAKSKPKKTAVPKKRTGKRIGFDWKKAVGHFKHPLRFVWIGAAAVAVYLVYCWATLPDIAKAVKASRPPKLVVLAADGTELASYGAKYGNPVDLNTLPPYVPQAVVATEDVRFYSHFGLDIRSIVRAAVTNLIKGRKAQGASTITQQVAKNLFLSSQKTFRRKVQEVMLSLWLEHNLSKDRILTIYLNRVYFGAGTYGLEAAAQKYYGVKARRLSLYQAAVLAGLLKAPTTYNPLTHPEAANKRARIVLANMAKAGYISATEGLNAAETGAKTGDGKNKSAFYFTDWIADETNAYLGNISQDIAIRTTLQPEMQTVLTNELTAALNGEEAREKHVSQAAGVIMAPDGAVLAMVGGKDYTKSQFNRAAEARRQIGSTVKPFVYLTAFEQGAAPSDIVEDKPIYLNGWSPKNASGRYYGKISLHDALVRSVNTVAVSTALKAGVRNVLKTARKFGVVGTDCKAEAAIALGVCQTRLIDLTAGYAALSNGGIGVMPYGISEILGANGEILYQRDSDGRGRLVNPRYIVDLDTVLIDVILKGTGKKANPGILAKGKTGTTQNYRDAWFVGYTRDFAAGIWVGNDDETPMDKVTGGGLPAEIWGKVVREISFDIDDDAAYSGL